MAKGDLLPKKFQVVLGTSNTNIVPAIALTKRFHVTNIRVINVNSATQTFHLYCVPSGQSESDQYLCSPKLSKIDGTSAEFGGGYYDDNMKFALEVGDKISGIASATTSIIVMITGLEESLS